MKLIRELRFGRPKTGKTKNVCESYPLPLLLMNWDKDGSDSITKVAVEVLSQADFKTKMVAKAKFEDKVYVVDYTTPSPAKLTADKFRSFSPKAYTDYCGSYNLLTDYCPFKTIVLDSATGLSDALMEFVAALNNAKQMEIQHWGQLAGKTQETIASACELPCNVVVIAHEQVDKDEITGEIRVTPLMFGQMREKVGAMFSQFIYSTTETGNDGKPKYVVYTAPKGLVKGIGMRLPQDRATVCGPTYKELYL